MRTALIALSVITVLAFPVRAQDIDGWSPLYSGVDTTGWSHVGEGQFVIEDGLLKTEGGMGLLWYTNRKISNAVIRVEYMNVDSSNSGIFIRIPESPTEPWMPVNRGYEVQIDPTLDLYHRTGVLYSLTEAQAKAERPGEWNVMEITLNGDRTIVRVNERLVTDYTEGDSVPPRKETYEPERDSRRPPEGFIGLQNHADGDVVYFRRVMVRPLP